MLPQEFQTANLPAECANLIRKWETKKLKAYPDPIGIPSIGYGHTRGVTAADVENSKTITDAQAEALLYEDIEEAVQIVRNNVTVPLNPYQFGALVSFVFNVGHGRKASGSDKGKDGFVILKNGKPSTLRARINAGDYEEAAAEFSRWVYAGGKKLNGLIARRAEETALFCREYKVAPTPPAEPEPPPMPFPSPMPRYTDDLAPPKPPLVDQPSPAPTRKVVAGGVAGALAFILVVVWNRYFPNDPIPADYATALTTGLVFIVSYVVRNRAQDIPPAPASTSPTQTP